MVATSDFSGLVSSAYAFASAAAIAPIVSLDRCMASLTLSEKIEADRARLRAFGSNAWPEASLAAHSTDAEHPFHRIVSSHSTAS